MRDLPDGPTLEALVRDCEELSNGELTSGDRERVIAMITRARAIAERESRAGGGALDSIRALLERLYGQGEARAQFRRLTDEIRSGRFDAPAPMRDEVRNLLWMLTLQKLRESNPNFLAAHGLE